VQQTRLAKQKQLRRGCIQSRLRSEFTMQESGRRVQFKKSMLRIGGKRVRPNACWLSTGGTACYLRCSQRIRGRDCSRPPMHKATPDY